MSIFIVAMSGSSRHLLVQKVADKGTRDQPNNHRKWERGRRRCEGHSGNEDNSLDAFPEDRDERQDKHGVLLEVMLDAAAGACVRHDGTLDGGSNLETPFLLHLADTQQGGADNGDDDACHQGKGAFIEQLAAVPFVCAGSVECANYRTADDETNDEAETCAEPNLQKKRRRQYHQYEQGGRTSVPGRGSIPGGSASCILFYLHPGHQASA